MSRTKSFENSNQSGNNELVLIENFTKERDSEVLDNYQILISNESIYFINSSADYSGYVKSIFSGIGNIAGLFGNTIGVVGGLVSELTGSKFSKILKEYSEKSSVKTIEKLKKNLDKMTLNNRIDLKNDFLKMDFAEVDSIVIKKGFYLNGKSFVEFKQKDLDVKLFPQNNACLNDLIDAIVMFGFKDRIQEKLF